MSSGSSGAALAAGVREAAQAAAAGDGVRFDNGEERPLGAKGRRTRAAILQGAGDAFRDLGWTATTVTTIAERAGVGTGTIYQYFRTKEEMLGALVGEWTLAALGQVRAWDSVDGRDGLRTLIQRFVSGYASTVEFQRVWEEVSITDAHLAQLRGDLTEVYVRLFAEAFVGGQAAGLLDAGPDPAETARALCAMVDRYCHQVFVRQAHRASPAEVADLLTRIWAAAIHLE
jgi:AcrR family transcriptional regulator